MNFITVPFTLPLFYRNFYSSLDRAINFLRHRKKKLLHSTLPAQCWTMLATGWTTLQENAQTRNFLLEQNDSKPPVDGWVDWLGGGEWMRTTPARFEEIS